MNLCTSVFVYVGSIGLYKRIVNADTQSIRIANADGQGLDCAILLSVNKTEPCATRMALFCNIGQYVRICLRGCGLLQLTWEQAQCSRG